MAEGLQRLVPGLLRTKANADPTDLEKSAVARHECQLGVISALRSLHREVHLGASHGIGHMLGPFGPVGHGETSCILLPAVQKFNAKHGDAAIQKKGGEHKEYIVGYPFGEREFRGEGPERNDSGCGGFD